ncbi:hypothetical protein HK100_006249, partial [Physocladia obscura]
MASSLPSPPLPLTTETPPGMLGRLEVGTKAQTGVSQVGKGLGLGTSRTGEDGGALRLERILMSPATTSSEMALGLQMAPPHALARLSAAQWRVAAWRMHPHWKTAGWRDAAAPGGDDGDDAALAAETLHAAKPATPDRARAALARLTLSRHLATAPPANVPPTRCSALIFAALDAAVAARSLAGADHVRLLLAQLKDQARHDHSLFKDFYMTLAALLAERLDRQLAWQAVKIGWNFYLDMINTSHRPRPTRIYPLERIVVNKLLVAFQSTPIHEVKKSRQALKELIVLLRSADSFHDDYPFLILAKLSSNLINDNENVLAQSSNRAESLRQLNIETGALFNSNGVIDFLEFAREHSWPIHPRAYSVLILNSIKGGNEPLADKLFIQAIDANFVLDAYLCKKILKSSAKQGMNGFADRVRKYFLSQDGVSDGSGGDNVMGWQHKQKRKQSFGDNDELKIREEIIQSWTICGNTTQIVAAKAYFEQFSDQDMKQWSIQTLLNVTGFHLRADQHDKALKSFQFMKETAVGTAALDYHSQKIESPEFSVEKLLTTYNKLETVYNQIITSLAKSYFLEKTMDFYTENQTKSKFGLNQKTCTVLIDTFGYQHPLKATQFLDDFESTPLTGVGADQTNLQKGDVLTYTALITGHIRASRLEHAIELLNRMKSKGIKPETGTFNSIIQGLGKAGRLEAAQEFITVMERENCLPDAYTFNSLMHLLLKRSRWTEARDILKRMEARKIPWTVTTFNIWINAHIRREGGNVKEAGRLFDVMQKAPYFFRPSADTYDAQLYYHVMQKDWDEAEKLLQEVYGLRAGGETGNSSLSNSSTDNNNVRYNEYKEVEKNYSSNENPKKILGEIAPHSMVKSFRILISALAEDDNLPRALGIYRALQSHPQFVYSRDQYRNFASIRTTLIRCAAKSGNDPNLKLCHELYAEQVEREGIDSVTDAMNAAILVAHYETGDYKGAISWANQIIPGAGDGKIKIGAVKAATKNNSASAATVKNNSDGVDNVDEATADSANILKEALYPTIGTVKFGRACTYALISVHSAMGSESKMEAIHAQMKRLEAVGYSNASEITTGDTGLSINEANVLIQGYGRLKNAEKALDIWKSMFRRPPASKNSSESAAGPFGVSRGGSSISSLGLVERFGVDRISVSVIIDSLSYSNMTQEIDRLWLDLKKAGFPVDLNNYISYSESLARRWDGKACLKFIEDEIIGGEHGLKITGKVFWSVSGMLSPDEINKLRRLMKQKCPQVDLNEKMPR